MKVAVVSFFYSQNIGDLSITKAIIELLESEVQVDTIINIDYWDATVVEGLMDEVNWDERKSLMKEALKESIKKVVPMELINEARYYLSKDQRIRQFKKALSDVDLLIIGGGNMIMDIFPRFVDRYIEYLQVAKELGIRTSTVVVGVGPLNKQQNKEKLYDILNHNNYISVRDKTSYDTLKEIYPDMISVTPDPVFSLNLKVVEPTIFHGNCVGINILSKVCFKDMDSYLSYIELVERLIAVCINDFNYRNFKIFSSDTVDYSSMKNVYLKYREVPSIHFELICPTNLKALDELLEKVDFVIAGRMHTMIFTQLKCVPFIGVMWQQKVQGFAKMVDEEDKILDYKYKYSNDELITIIDSALIEGYHTKKEKRNLELRKQVINESKKWI